MRVNGTYTQDSLYGMFTPPRLARGLVLLSSFCLHAHQKSCAVTLMRELVLQFTSRGSHLGVSWDYHVRARSSFQDEDYLQGLFDWSVTLLQQLGEASPQNGGEREVLVSVFFNFFFCVLLPSLFFFSMQYTVSTE